MYELYKGYIPTKGKKAAIKFKNQPLYTHDQVKKLPEYAGVLNDNTILIDVDDKEQANLFMDIVEDKQLNCKVYQTRRGMHFVFKNCGVEKAMTAGTLACGISNVDVKVGSKASYEVLKLDGKERFVIWDIEDDCDYDCLPEWARPLTAKTDFHTLGEGDGRNMEIFKYVSYLQREGLSRNAIEEAVNLINNYVLKNSLPMSEINTLLRDERFEKPSFFGRGGTFLFDQFAKWFVNEHHLIRINGDIYTFDGQVYTNSKTIINKQMVEEISMLNKTKRKEVEDYLELIVTSKSEADSRYIAFQNGVYDIKSKTFGEFSKDKIVTNQLQCNYDPTVVSPVVDKALDDFCCHNEGIRLLLEEVVGYCMYSRQELRKAFILVGDKMNGKSTFLSMLKALFGYKNVASLDLKELGDRFKTAELSGKLVNIGDDIEDEFISNSAIFKKLVTGNPITVERKGQDPFVFSNKAKLLFSANSVPKIRDKTGAVMSRLVLVPFNAHFTPDSEGFDLEIIDKLTSPESLSYLAHLGIDALERILSTNAFTESEEVQKLLYEYKSDNDPVYSFIDDVGLDSIMNEDVLGVYARFKVYCNENGYMQCAKRTFIKQLHDKFDIGIKTVKIKGTERKVFV